MKGFRQELQNPKGVNFGRRGGTRVSEVYKFATGKPKGGKIKGSRSKDQGEAIKNTGGRDNDL